MLQEPAARDALGVALADVDRLVLLGDVVELRHGPLREALAAAAPALATIGAALAGREVVIVPGNHDHRLLDPWLERRAGGESPELGLETAVDSHAGEALHHLAAALAPARVRVSYPGVWLRDDVYALHGHYGDLHTTVPTFERLGAGLAGRALARRRPARAEDYEAVLAPMYGLIDRLAEHRTTTDRLAEHRTTTDRLAEHRTTTLGERAPNAPSSRMWRALEGDGGPGALRRRALRTAVAGAVGALNRAGLGPLRADLSGPALRRGGLAACADVVAGLGVAAPYIIFGHTHRAGPLPGDDAAEWQAGGRCALLNTGSWIHEPDFLGSSPTTSPYRPGFAAIVAPTGAPELVNLLDP